MLTEKIIEPLHCRCIHSEFTMLNSVNVSRLLRKGVQRMLKPLMNPLKSFYVGFHVPNRPPPHCPYREGQKDSEYVKATRIRK